MKTSLSRLKKGKGTPPALDTVADVMAQDPRRFPERPVGLAHADAREATRPLQVRIPADVFEAFSEQAVREFGFTHGAKKRLFLKIWGSYLRDSGQP